MSEILNDLKPFNKILHGQQKPSYETSKGFVSGSFESHFKQNIQYPYRISVNLKEIVLDLYANFVEKDYTSMALFATSHHDLSSHENSHINKDNLVYTTKFILDELLNYAEKNGLNIDKFKVSIEQSLDNIEKEVDRIDKYFEDINTLSFMCSKFSKISKTGQTERSEFQFNKIKSFLLSDTHELLTFEYNHPTTYFINSIFHDEFTHLMNIRNEVINTLKKERVNNNVLTLADSFVLNQNNLSELQKSIIDKNTIKKIEFTSSQKISGVVLFNDGSCSFKEGNNEYKTPLTLDSFVEKTKSLYLSSIDYHLRKKPSLAKLFKSKLIEEEYSMNLIIGAMERFVENEPLVKSYLKDGYEAFLKDLMDNKSIEVFDDAYSKIANQQKFNQFAYSITSKKYRDLYNEESLEILKQLYENKIDPEQLQNFVGKKIALFKTPEEFNSHLNKYLSKINGFDVEIILDSIKKLKATIVSNKNNILIVETKNYDQMYKLGSPSWCIVRDDSYYKDYTKNGNRQYILFNFNKESKDNHSIIGITLCENGRHRNSHVKNDDSISRMDVQPFTDTIILSHPETYKHLDPELQDRLFAKKETNIKLKIG